MHPQVMLPSFEATHHGIQLLFMNRSSQLCSIELAFKNNRRSILHEDSFNSEVICICVNFEWFGEIQKLQHKGARDFFFQVFKYPLLFFFPLKKNCFLRRSKSGFIICENIFMNFRQKLVRRKKDQIPLAMIGLFQSLMAYNFLRLGFTPPLDKICPRKSISSQANSLLTLLANSLFCWNLLKNILNVLHVLQPSQNTPRYHQCR